MLVKENEKNNDCLEKGCFTCEPEVMRAADLLYEVLNASYVCSRTCLEREINGQRENVGSLYWKHKELMEQIAKGGRKTAFLAMSAMEQTFTQALPLLLTKVEDIAGGDMSQIEAVLELKKAFAEDPYKEMWREKAGKYRGLIEKLGFPVQEGDYEDLTAIMDPLLDAFTFYEGRTNFFPPAIHKARGGRRSVERPYIARSICKYSSEKELVDAAAGCGKESMIMFGAVEKTNRQTEDGFQEWYYGRKSERMRNTMYHERISEEEYLAQVCGYSQSVYLCVKSGEAIWLVRMPYAKDSYAGEGYGPESKFYAGRRAGYAPYEVFYKGLQAADKDDAALSIPRKGWLLAELMDGQQKAWFPAFIEETIEKFFGKEEPEADTWILPEEMMAAIPGSILGGEERPGKGCIVPSLSGMPSVPGYVHGIRRPEEVFAEEEMRELVRQFHVTERDILDAPVLPVKCGTEEETAKHIEENIRKAYAKALAEKAAAFLEGKWEVRRMALDRISMDEGRIIQEAAEGKFSQFMEIVVDKDEKTGRDGKTVTVHTTMEDCEESPYIQSGWQPKILWAGDILYGKAPVVWKIRPKDAAEYAALLGMPEEELPDVMKLSGLLSWFYKEYCHVLPNSLVDEYAGMGWGSTNGADSRRSIFLPRMADVNICMGKKVYNKYRKALDGAGKG